MKTFELFLTESSKKNLHIEHVEDEVFNRGLVGAMDCISFLKAFNSLLEGSAPPLVQASIKWDGSPSIVCGKHPKTGKFFLGTKSVFNTTVPKINYSTKDIYENYVDQPNLANRLCVAFNELSKLDISEVVQGDLLFVEQDLVSKSHNGQTHITFKPNTITYSIPANTLLGESVAKAKVGVVFHTTYTGSCMDSLIPTYKADIISTSPSVVIFKSTINTKHTTKTEHTHPINNRISDLISHFNTLDESALKTISSTPAMQRIIKRYINSKIALGESVSISESYVNEFYQFLETNHKKFLGYFLEHRQQVLNLFLFVEKAISIKESLLRLVSHPENVQMFIESATGFNSTTIEGVVISNTTGNVVKLVNRLEFSYRNFNNKGLV